jgi:hypothetical protein
MEGAPWFNVGGRAWFADADRPGRRLAVHARPDRGWVTLSVWDGEECRATFHLRQAEAPHLLYELAAGLAEGGRPADPADPVTGPRPVAPPWQAPLDTAANLMGRGSQWLRTLANSLSSPPAPAPARLRAVEDVGDDPEPSPG